MDILYDGILCVLTQNMPFISIRKENHPKLSQICMG